MLAAEKGLNVSQGEARRKCIAGGEGAAAPDQIYRSDFNRVIGMVFAVEMKSGGRQGTFFANLQAFAKYGPKGIEGEIQSWHKRIRDWQKPST